MSETITAPTAATFPIPGKRTLSRNTLVPSERHDADEWELVVTSRSSGWINLSARPTWRDKFAKADWGYNPGRPAGRRWSYGQTPVAEADVLQAIEAWLRSPAPAAPAPAPAAPAAPTAPVPAAPAAPTSTPAQAAMAAAQAAAEAALAAPARPVRVNARAGYCTTCNERVAAGAGRLEHFSQDRLEDEDDFTTRPGWHVFCLDEAACHARLAGSAS